MAQLTRLPDAGQFPPAELLPTTPHRYRLLAARVDRRPFFLPASARRRAVLRSLVRQRDALREVSGIRDVSVFDAILRPPVRSQFLRDRPEAPPRPRFDVVVLVEAENDMAGGRTPLDVALEPISGTVSSQARGFVQFDLVNARSLGVVDHTRPGTFLFNFFVADDLEQNLAVWEYTAGWFQDQTGLDNSTVLQPVDPVSPYTIINHCRWDRLTDVVVPLSIRRSLRSYVLAHFDANDTAPMPILYRLVQ